jgi:hypothetical protein
LSVYAQDYGYFFNSNNSDRTYNADSFETWLKPFFVSGVFTGCLQVKAQDTPDMSVVVTKGYANIDGKAAYWPDDNTVTIETASGVYSRIDTIVLRRDNTNRRVSIEVVKGTASATPQPVAPTRNADTFELVLAEVLVGVGVTTITGSVITDKRPDTDVCGYVVAAVQTPDFSELYDQFVAQAEEFMGDQADEFIAWFDEMKDQLSEDAAGHLQLEIEALDSGKINRLASSAAGFVPAFSFDGNLYNTGFHEATLAKITALTEDNWTSLARTPRILNKGDIYGKNGIVYKVLREIPANTLFSDLTSSDVVEMRLAAEVTSLNSKFTWNLIETAGASQEKTITHSTLEQYNELLVMLISNSSSLVMASMVIKSSYLSDNSVGFQVSYRTDDSTLRYTRYDWSTSKLFTVANYTGVVYGR